MSGQLAQSLLWFIAILVLIPVALWLLKRTPVGAGSGTTGMRTIGALPLSASQRIVTVEVGQGDERRWLVLGVTPQSITTLHTLAPQGEAPAATGAEGAPFAQLLSRFRGAQGTGPQDGGATRG
jgi:flagellar protein FliO/FliZ